MSLNFSWRVVCKSTVTNVAKMRSFEVMCDAFDAYNNVSNIVFKNKTEQES